MLPPLLPLPPLPLVIDEVRGRVGMKLPSRPIRSRARWSERRAAEWAAATGWLVGCNFTPSTAGNQLEMWQESTFDPATIDRELGWAADRFGMNSIRLFLHDLVWEADGAAFLDRIDRVLDIAAGHGIGVMPVLFDGVWDPAPRLGVQRDPVPGRHNSIWVQSPGAAVLHEPERWPALRPYVDAVMGRFATDPRIVVWDLFNEPDNPAMGDYAALETPHKKRRAGRLVDLVFDWATDIDPDAPLTVGAWINCWERSPQRVSSAARVGLERSDVISFHSYEPEDRLRASIERLGAIGRPMLCTEWLGRPRSSARLLEVFAEQQVGCFNWGLVDGRTQTKFPWTSWRRSVDPAAPWFHELLHPDGAPYDEDEAALFRSLSPARALRASWSNCNMEE